VDRACCGGPDNVIKVGKVCGRISKNKCVVKAGSCDSNGICQGRTFQSSNCTIGKRTGHCQAIVKKGNKNKNIDLSNLSKSDRRSINTGRLTIACVASGLDQNSNKDNGQKLIPAYNVVGPNKKGVPVGIGKGDINNNIKLS